MKTKWITKTKKLLVFFLTIAVLFTTVVPTTVTAVNDHDPECNGEYVGVITVRPTCEAGGIMTYTCPVCGDSYQETLSKLDGHISVVSMDGSYSAPTYTGNGSSRVGSTSVSLVFTLSDGSIDERTEGFSGVNSTTVRNPIYDLGCYKVTVAITVTTTGTNNNMNITGVTANITDTVLNDDIHAHCDHDYESKVNNPTCEEDGYTTYTCTICGDSYFGDYVPALGHNWGDWVITINATDTEDGEEARVCANDPAHIDVRIIAAIGRDWGDWVVTTPATCEEEGEETRVDNEDPTNME
ncbi:MAG: hypothetical protein FWH55_00435, partial [Oscillospiraceae bacterium]|nr:hypothetical protein [Oscillospiraceae bacterium]